tara:strand:+ start:612 stop:1055 length:444 start_codon:yes stop_codon:yes gene_type:complete
MITHIITAELYSAIPNIQEILKLKNSIVVKNLSNPFKKMPLNTKTSIYIYDISKNYKIGKSLSITPINNHINKTGINPLRKKENKKIKFYDITKIYQQNSKGKIAVCYGKKPPSKIETKHISAGYLCYFSVIAKLFYSEKVYGFVIE